MDFDSLVIEDINSNFDRDSFSCGISDLDCYLKTLANMHHKTGLNKTKILTPDNSIIIGFFSFAASFIKRESLPVSIINKYPNYPLPCFLLTRFAVDQKYQHMNVGGYLLKRALQHAYLISQEMGSLAVIVDAKNQNAKGFYQHYGFRELDSNMTLFILMKEIKPFVK
ncbi:MAG: GNAT family N-acetyltransferase [Bacteroidetes bacterium]|nr:GNAT family N-acetyltransferase [Bacteroidota bacterium]